MTPPAPAVPPVPPGPPSGAAASRLPTTLPSSPQPTTRAEVNGTDRGARRGPHPDGPPRHSHHPPPGVVPTATDPADGTEPGSATDPGGEASVSDGAGGAPAARPAAAGAGADGEALVSDAAEAGRAGAGVRSSVQSSVGDGAERPGGAAGEQAAGDGGGVAGEPADGEVRLPEPVRARVVALAADALGRLGVDEVPASLRAVARFTPAKRARLGSPALAAALAADPAFRLAAAARAEQVAPEITAAVRDGAVPGMADPVELAAAAYLLRAAGWPEYVERARAALDEAAERDRARARAGELERLRVELAAARTGAATELARAQAAADEARAQAEALRRQLRDQTGQRRAAERLRTAAEETLAEERRRAATAESAASAEVRRLRQRLAEAADTVESARRAGRDARQADDARLWLLLDTVAGAVQGLRRELALTPTDERPADAVSAAAPRPHQLGARGDDPGQLDRLLELPRVHLVVDGYNVTKSGYGDLPLAVQRNRLVGGLGALAARTGAEVSCVFDGAARPPAAPPTPRGVRVLFSSPGETADDLIRRLVAAEPAGRPVVVVSSDREVADGVRRTGVYPMPSTALLRRLDRG